MIMGANVENVNYPQDILYSRKKVVNPLQISVAEFVWCLIPN